jgi:3-hydroxyacyl-CoA dehydrogenase/enoyl-CoA hydratase/3-hydroxybutyryl-CoA epimerase
MKTNSLPIDREGVALLSIDVPDAPLNTLSDRVVEQWSTQLQEIVEQRAARGLVITSAKQCFGAGWDLHELLALLDSRPSAAQLAVLTAGLSAFLRRLETAGLPVAAAINGFALGGSLELALACHYRVLADSPDALVGLPEVTVGLLPGGGGTQRLPRLIGARAALPLLLEGKSLRPREALEAGVVDAVLPAAEIIAEARRWVLANPQAKQRWDLPSFVVSGGRTLASAEFAEVMQLASPAVTKTTYDNFPAPRKILESVYEGLAVPFDRGLAIERRCFAELAAGPVARSMIGTLFVSKGRADKLARRPAGVPPRPVRTLGVIGAGMMGAGLAYWAAVKKLRVVVLDTTPEFADRARGYASRALAREIEKGRISSADGEAVLSRIRPTTTYDDLAPCEFVIEAVFEDREVKADVTVRAERALDARAVFATNTSTLPITGLAAASRRAERFIGMHFFSPVERMPLVEIIRGAGTGDEALALALDLARAFGKTPIVVNDSRGFFTSRVFGTYCYEGQKLLEEGVAPALIENAGRFAGMPVGPLAVMDEVSLALQYHVVKQTELDLGAAFAPPIGWNVLRHFVEDLKRVGRKAGAGFYEYPAGARKYLWPGLAHEYPLAAQQPSLESVKQRLLYVQALESARCLQEGVLTCAADGDLGSIMGWGFPTYTGGALSLIDQVGVARFVMDCRRLADLYGARFEPTDDLVARASRQRSIHAAA